MLQINGGYMNKLVVSAFVVLLLMTTILSAQNGFVLPKGWHAAGSKPAEFEMGIDRTTYQNGKSSVCIKSKDPKGNDFGTVMQYIVAENYLGKRLKLSGYIKSSGVEGWCGMWMRIDGESGLQLGFDNMSGRSIRGTNDWKKYEIVLDVPSASKAIAFGVLLGGKGKVWFDNMKIEEVDKSVPVTNLMREMSNLKEPVNLDLEE